MAVNSDSSITDGTSFIGTATYANMSEPGVTADSILGASQTEDELREQPVWYMMLKFFYNINFASIFTYAGSIFTNCQCGRIMKKAIPNSGKISKEAKECCQECVSEFISFITSEASDRCSQEKRKTINGEDILYAMSSLGFDNYVEPLKVYLHKYRESTKAKCGISSVDDTMFAEGSTIIATLGDGPQGQNVYYPAQYIATAALDAD
ncbi:Nf-YB [Bugula neritina]|uniref:Nuclear transcription factor Y subunit beta n=1 Tax=Bugula neritina TaxID=10212 RepID=A0A7J7JJP9_BUGNE|nr:Nf-YB [Bugula neritina]